MNHHISDRNFGLGLSVIFLAIWGFLWYQAGSPSFFVFSITITLAVCAWIIPKVFIPLNCLFMALSRKVSTLMNHLILGSIFFILITPIFVLARIFNWDPMERSSTSLDSTYWKKSCGKITAEQFLDQF